ncbi:MAG: hypothetical protein DWQ10_00120 [Calditrichaeota bacterium]|nr:MAG: hypothetical protein DWQ10_00120 [Calditrichota bacterium]
MLFLILTLQFVASLLFCQTHDLNKLLGTKELVTDVQNKVVYLPATFHAAAYDGSSGHTNNYHAVVWDGGGASNQSPFTTQVNDSLFYAALVKIGAVPGNNLKHASWAKRKDRKHPAPKMRVQGSPVVLTIWWQGAQHPLPIERFFLDPGEKGIELRFGGNLELIHKWHSGCIVCLFSCPGGKVSNAAYTIRDYVDKTTKFEMNKINTPADETPVVLIFKLVEE